MSKRALDLSSQSGTVANVDELIRVMRQERLKRKASRIVISCIVAGGTGTTTYLVFSEYESSDTE